MGASIAREKTESLSHPHEKEIHVLGKSPKSHTFRSILSIEVPSGINNNITYERFNHEFLLVHGCAGGVTDYDSK